MSDKLTEVRGRPALPVSVEYVDGVGVGVVGNTNVEAMVGISFGDDMRKAYALDTDLAAYLVESLTRAIADATALNAGQMPPWGEAGGGEDD